MVSYAALLPKIGRELRGIIRKIGREPARIKGLIVFDPGAGSPGAGEQDPVEQFHIAGSRYIAHERANQHHPFDQLGCFG